MENAFGILAQRFRCLLHPLQLKTENVEKVVFAVVTLHNYIRSKHPQAVLSQVDREHPQTHQVIPGQWRSAEALHSMEVLQGRNHSVHAKTQRRYLKEYYVSQVGKVSWQDRLFPVAPQ